MPKGIMVVQSCPSDPAREEEFNEWYSQTHVPELLTIAGIVSAHRYKVHGEADRPYLAVYEIEADDITAPMKEWAARSAAGQANMSDAMQLDPPPVITFYTEIS